MLYVFYNNKGYADLKQIKVLVVLMQCENEDVLAMMRVLVGVEMFQCNRNPKHMEFTVPSLSEVCTAF